MLKDKLNSSFYKKNAAQEFFTKILHILVKSQKKIMLTLLLVPNIFIFQNVLRAESQGREIQIYVRSGAALQARKRKAYENSQKESGIKIKHYLINTHNCLPYIYIYIYIYFWSGITLITIIFMQ